MPKKKEGFDNIFASTAPAKNNNNKAKKAGAAPEAKPAARPEAKRIWEANPLKVLKAAWTTHESEVLYRKAKEDRLLIFSVALLIAVVFGAAYVLGTGRALAWHTLSKLIFRLFFVGAAFGVAFAFSSLIELNRKRLQDLLSMIVKIQESLGFFEEGAIPGSDGAFFPNTYKFIGSMNDDETNYAQMIVKVTAGAAMIVILLLV